ncbi:acetylcholine-gated chloride channel subunit acc-3-like [Hyalella azteca]|uniref:Acetylcholine-gated chloride channel subunit acc-3-like n=1 Tax=Hyalella azteca TaxID=294128 RepID=A0A8B7NVH1_HYAAZ|nr:acetylcholine-gated chloride channel subunit acc-3-like [Hyalella azteca]
MVALTAMLVQTTFFTQVGDHLPRTSYLKLIDVWCVLCIAMLFCIILCLVIINHHVVRAERASVKKRPSLRDEPKKNGRNKRLSGIKTRKYSSEVRDLGEVLGSQHALKVCWRHDDVSDVPGAGMRDEEFDAGAAMAYKLNRFACWLFVGLMTALVMGFSAVALN